MDNLLEERARKLVELMEPTGKTCGLLVLQGAIVLRTPGAPYTDTPILQFEECDLNNAVALGLLERQRVTGSYDWEWYVRCKTHSGDTK
jgi:hypothetical protein